LSLELFNSENSKLYFKLVEPGKHLTNILQSLNDYLKQLKHVQQLDSFALRAKLGNAKEPSHKMQINLMNITNFCLLRALTSPEQNFSTVEKLANDVLIVLLKQARNDDAIQLCSELLEIGINVSTNCVSDVIDILAKQTKYLEAERVYALFEENCALRGVPVDSRVTQSRLQSMCYSGRQETAMCIVDQLRADGQVVDSMYTVILKAHMDRGMHARVDDLWNRMRTLNVQPSVSMLTIMLDHYTKTHSLDRALQLATQAVQQVSLDQLFFTSLFRLCSASKQWQIKHPADLVPRVLSLMALQQFPSVSWALRQAMQVLCEAGDAAGAEFYYWELMRKGHPPGADVMEMLLEAYSISSQLVSRSDELVVASGLSTPPPLSKLFVNKAVVVGKASTPFAGMPPLQHVSAEEMVAVRQSVRVAESFEDPYARARPSACKGWVAARYARKTWDLNHVVVPEKLAERISSLDAGTVVSDPAMKRLRKEVGLYNDLLTYGTAPPMDLEVQCSETLQLNVRRAEMIFRHMMDLQLPVTSVAVLHLITVLAEAGETDRAMAALDLHSTYSVKPTVEVYRPLVSMYLRLGDRTQAGRAVEVISERFGMQAPQSVLDQLLSEN
jgi:pentatricopeptide repeat protein